MSREAPVLVAALAAGAAVLLLVPARPGQLPAGFRRGAPSPPSSTRGSTWTSRLTRRVRPAPAPPVAELLTALAAELAAGQPTGTALESAAAGLDPHPCPRAVAACRSGADVATALRADAQAPGARALRGLAACWEVSERSGAGLSVAVARLAGGLRAAAEADAQLVGEVAAVRTSARLLAGLPVLGLLIGQWIGADPLVWLTGSGVGRVVLGVGVALQLAGMAWLHHMVAATRASL